MRKPPLKRRELVELLVHNGFEKTSRGSTSHIRYVGKVDGKVKFVDVDDNIDEYDSGSHSALYWIVYSQLGFIGPGQSTKKGWERFYAGSPLTAEKAGVKYLKW